MDDKVLLVEHRFHLRVPKAWKIEDIQKYVNSHWTAIQRVEKDMGVEVVADVSSLYAGRRYEEATLDTNARRKNQIEGTS